VTAPARAPITDPSGRFALLAIDHRDSLRQFLRPEDPASLDGAEITALKIDLVAGLGDLVTGVMLEPEYSIPQVVDAGVLPVGVGFLAALEAQGYLDDPGAGPTRILPGWSAELAAGSGASAAKLLVPYHPDRPLARAQEKVIEQTVADCRAAGLPLLLEPLHYDLDDPADRPRVVVESVRRLAPLGPDVLKLPFPGTAAASRELTSIAGRPWVLLSGGGSFADFRRDLGVALGAGCAGFAVGRALWGEAAREADPASRSAVVRELIRPRLDSLVAMLDGVGTR
jgi:tagatose-1,6-bisphosphate aldolase